MKKVLISIAWDVLKDVSKNGLKGNHNFYIRFLTEHPKTKVPKFFKEHHPEEFMIFIQYQYWNLDFTGTYDITCIPFIEKSDSDDNSKISSDDGKIISFDSFRKK